MRKGQKIGQDTEKSPFSEEKPKKQMTVTGELASITGNDAVRYALAETGITQAALSKQLGYEGQSTISFAINSKRMSLEKFVEMLNGLGYSVLVAKNTVDGYQIKCEVQ